MDKITRKTSFGQWFSPINLSVFEVQVKTKKLDFYTKKLTTESFLKLLLFAQLQEIESLHALSDCLFDDQLQKEVDLDSISISQLSRRLNGITYVSLSISLTAKLLASARDQTKMQALSHGLFLPFKVICGTSSCFIPTVAASLKIS